MGRRKIQIKAIQTTRNRTITFIKRKSGIHKKAYELSVLCQCDVAVIIFYRGRLVQFSTKDMRQMVEEWKKFRGSSDGVERKTTSDFDIIGGDWEVIGREYAAGQERQGGGADLPTSATDVKCDPRSTVTDRLPYTSQNPSWGPLRHTQELGPSPAGSTLVTTPMDHHPSQSRLSHPSHVIHRKRPSEISREHSAPTVLGWSLQEPQRPASRVPGILASIPAGSLAWRPTGFPGGLGALLSASDAFLATRHPHECNPVLKPGLLSYERAMPIAHSQFQQSLLFPTLQQQAQEAPPFSLCAPSSQTGMPALHCAALGASTSSPTCTAASIPGLPDYEYLAQQLPWQLPRQHSSPGSS